MKPSERLARAQRAEAAWNEFVEPLIASMEEEYTSRLADVAATELHPGNRSDKITTLAIALRVAANVKAGMQATIKDGEVAQRELLRADNIERMSDAQQRLLKIVGY